MTFIAKILVYNTSSSSKINVIASVHVAAWRVTQHEHRIFGCRLKRSQCGQGLGRPCETPAIFDLLILFFDWLVENKVLFNLFWYTSIGPGHLYIVICDSPRDN